MQIRTEELLEVIGSLGRNPGLGLSGTFPELLFPSAGQNLQIAEQVFFLQRQRRFQQALKKLLVAIRESLTDTFLPEDNIQSLMRINSGRRIAEIGDVGQALVHAPWVPGSVPRGRKGSGGEFEADRASRDSSLTRCSADGTFLQAQTRQRCELAPFLTRSVPREKESTSSCRCTFSKPNPTVHRSTGQQLFHAAHLEQQNNPGGGYTHAAAYYPPCD